MKKCPYCAEEIQDEAIKCRFCNSFLSATPGAAGTPGGGAPAAGGVATGAVGVAAGATGAAPATVPAAPAPFRPAPGPAVVGATGTIERRVIYDGAPSWRVYLGMYIYGVLGTAVLLAVCVWIGWNKVPTEGKVLLALVPLAVGAIYFAAIYFYRRSIRFRVTTTNIELERGIVTKRIDVVELWRCRDVRYKQNLVDRLLGIAHIEIISADALTPQIEIVGVPASRQLFEQIRDSIEIQRQSHNVYGVVS